MAQSNLVQGARRLAGNAENAIMSIPTPRRKPEYTSWHGDMVREANESFRKQSEARKTAKKVPVRRSAKASARSKGRASNR